MKIKNIKVVSCRGCCDQIFFVKINGKFHPLNFNPKLVFVPKEFIKNDQNEIIEVKQWEIAAGYESHFATCKFAHRFRKKSNINGNK